MLSILCRAFSLFWWLSAEMKQIPGLGFRDFLNGWMSPNRLPRLFVMLLNEKL